MYFELLMDGKSPEQSAGQAEFKPRAFEDLLAALSARFVAFMPEQVDGEIRSALKGKIELLRSTIQPCFASCT